MKVFILYDDTDRAYPIMGVYSTFENAVEAAEGHPDLCIYEEELDTVSEPTYHAIPPEEAKRDSE